MFESTSASCGGLRRIEINWGGGYIKLSKLYHFWNADVRFQGIKTKAHEYGKLSKCLNIKINEVKLILEINNDIGECYPLQVIIQLPYTEVYKIDITRDYCELNIL